MGTVIFSEEVDNTLANDVPDDNCSNSISTDETNELLQMIDKLQKKVNELEARSHHPHPDNNSHVTNSNVPTGKPSIVVNMPSLDHLLPTFGGLFTENPHTFVTKLEENLKNYQIPTQNWIYLIKPQFIGQAKLWFENGKEGRETVYFIGYVPTTNDVFTVDDAEINTAFTSDLKARLKKLLEKYSTVFDNSKPLSQTKDITHKINMKNNKDLKTLFNDSVEEDEYVDQKRQSLRLLEKKARDNMFKYKEKYASKETPKPLEPAQEVYLRNHQLSSAPNNVTASLLPRWHGPYIIQKHLGGGVYKCVHAQNTKDVRKVDQSQMQLYPNDV
ncbi:hypothetical protein M8J76_011150 [Diaphorina citri]|nr:hypothetical protein M8J76_011150 [Diaphorina citri]